MSSIAYILDKNLIEFHRLNGNKSVNIFRPYNAKKIINFDEGDYLFFLAKGSERESNKEKGIIGYGHFRKSQMMTCKQMWNIFTQSNGYNTQEEMIDAIRKSTRDKKIPSKMNSLYLDKVVYFQEPIYLSELGMDTSQRVESFVNLDDPVIVSKIFEKAKDTGMDIWSLVVNNEEEEESYFDVEETKHRLFSLCELLELEFTTWEIRKAKKWLKDIQVIDKHIKNIKGNKIVGYKFYKDIIHLYLPLVNGLELNNNTQAIFGNVYLIKTLFKEKNGDEIKFKIHFLSDEDVQELEKLVNRN